MEKVQTELWQPLQTWLKAILKLNIYKVSYWSLFYIFAYNRCLVAKENAPATGGDGLQEKKPNNEQRIHTSQWLTSTETVRIIFKNHPWWIFHLKTNESNKSIRGISWKPYRVQMRWARSRRISKSPRLEQNKNTHSYGYVCEPYWG